jgi:hypothetical protein
MTANALTRKPLLFLVVAAAAVALERALLATRGFAVHAVTFSSAVIFDVVVGLPLAWWLLVVRGDLPDRLRGALGGSAVARIVANELAMLGLAFFSWRSRPEPGTLSVHRRSAWTAVCMAVLLVSVPEAAGLHVLIARWSPSAAWAASALGIYGVAWLLGDLRALQLRGVTVSGGLLRIRIGVRREADVPLSSISAIEQGGAPGADRLAVLGAPTLTLRLREPVEVRSLFGKARRATALALQIDDPAAFRALLAR